MAKVLYGSQITGLIGSIGGLTFQTSNQSDIVRLRPISSNSLSADQQTQTSLFSEAIAAWALLSLANQALWQAFAVLHTKTSYYNEQKQLSGYNWFVSLYITATVLGSTPLVAPPTFSTIPQPPQFAVDLKPHSSQLSLTFTPTYVHTGQVLLYFTSPLVISPIYSDRSNLFFTALEVSGSTNYYQLWHPYIDTFLDGNAFTCKEDFKGGIKIGVVAVNSTSFLSSPMAFGFAPHVYP